MKKSALKRRRSIRANYDYSEPGWYHVTICAGRREHVFGHITDDRMYLNHIGHVARQAWHELSDHFQGLGLDSFMIMPNHIHLLIVLTKRTQQRDVPGGAGSPRPARRGYQTLDINWVPVEVITHDHAGRFIKQGGETPPLRGILTLGQVVGYYKYQVTKRINKIRRTPGQKLFQRNYWEKIVSNDHGINVVREYIRMNPKKWEYDPDRL